MKKENKIKRKGAHLHLTTTIITVLMTAIAIALFVMSFTTNYYVFGGMNSHLILGLMCGAIVSAILAVVLTKKLPKAFWPKLITFVTTALLAWAALLLVGDRVEGIGICILTDYDSGHGGEEAIYYSLGAVVMMLVAMIYNIIGSFHQESDAPAGRGKTLGFSISAAVLSVATVIAILGLVGVDLTGGTQVNPSTVLSGGEKVTYKVSYNMNNENLDGVQEYQFLSGNLSGMLHFDARFYVDYQLDLDGNGNYTLVSDAYCVENGKRATIGDDTGLGMNLKTTAEGTYTLNADGTVTTSAASHAVHQMEMDTYSSQMKGAAQMNVGGNDADGIYDSRDTQAVLDFVPETVWTVDKETKTILGYREAPPSGTFTVSWNMNNENLDGIKNYQFLSGDLSGMLHYDARFYVDYALTLDNGIYTLVSEGYCVENGKRAEIGDDTGLGMVLKTTAEGLYTANDDGTVTTHTPTHAVHEMRMDTYSSQMKGAAQMNVGGNDADGVYDSNTEPAMFAMVPETTWTLDNASKAITGYKKADPSGTFTVSLNMNNENLDIVNNQQFLSGDLSGMLHYDARFFVDYALTLDGKGNYILVSDAYCVENGKRAEIGDDTGLGMNLRTTAEGTYVVNEDETVTTSPAAHAVHQMQMDTYSSQMKGAAQMNVGGNEADGIYDSADTPAVLDFVPEVTWTLDNSAKTILAYTVVLEETEEQPAEEPAQEEPAAEAKQDEAPAAEAIAIPSVDGGTTATFRPDGTFVFDFAAYGIQEVGTWTFADGKLTVNNPNGLEATAEGDPLKLHYVSAASEQLTGDYDIPVSALTFETTAPAEEVPATEPAVIPSTDGGTTATFQPDGTFVFDFAAYNIQEVGTWTFDDGKLMVTNPNGLEAVAEDDPLKLHYISAASEQLTGDYEIPAAVLAFNSVAPVDETPIKETSASSFTEFTVPSDDAGTKMTFRPDGTYRFDFESYSIVDEGTFTYESGVLTLTDANGLQYTGEGDPIKLHYGYSGAPDQLTGEYTIDAALFFASATAPAAEEAAADTFAEFTVPSDDAGTKMTFRPDGTYRFDFESYSIVDEGTFTYENGKLTLTDANGLQYTSEGDPIKLHYGYSGAPDQLTGEYTIDTAMFAATAAAPATEAPAVEPVIIPSIDGGTTATFQSDGTFVFDFPAYSIQEIGTWSFSDGKLTVTNPNGLEAAAEGDPLKLHYVSAASDMLTGDYEIPVGTFVH